jgi:hypothetical protein
MALINFITRHKRLLKVNFFARAWPDREIIRVVIAPEMGPFTQVRLMPILFLSLAFPLDFFLSMIVFFTNFSASRVIFVREAGAAGNLGELPSHSASC